MDAIDVTGAAGVDAALVNMEVRTLPLVVDCTEPPTADPGVDDCRGVRSLCCPPPASFPLSGVSCLLRQPHTYLHSSQLVKISFPPSHEIAQKYLISEDGDLI